MKTDKPIERTETTPKEGQLTIAINLEWFAQFVKCVLDTRQFGTLRILDDDDPITPSVQTVDSEQTPPWLIHKDDLEAIQNLHTKLIKAADATNIPEDAPDPDRTEEFVASIGACIVSKIIVLIHALLLCYNYYQVKSVPYPGQRPSDLLNPLIVPDLHWTLVVCGYTLFQHRDEFPARRAAFLKMLYRVMKLLFDVLAGMLPCAEVDALRAAYDTFHDNGGTAEDYRVFYDRLLAASRRFAAEEPKWERARAESPYQAPAPVVIPGTPAQPPKTGKGSRPRKQIPVKVAAALFGVSANTIHNWETLKTTPPEEYPGRDIGLSAFEQYADQYDIRLHNKKQLLKNRAEGL